MITLRQLDILKMEVDELAQRILNEFYRDLAGDRAPEPEEAEEELAPPGVPYGP